MAAAPGERDYAGEAAVLRRRLAAVDLADPVVDRPAAAAAVRRHLRALGLRGFRVGWLDSPELLLERSTDPRWLSSRRGVLLEGYHHLDLRLPSVPVRGEGIVGVDLALIRRTVGVWRTPRSIRVLSADADSIIGRLAAGTMTLRAARYLPALEPLVEAVEHGAFALTVSDGGVLLVPRPRIRFDAQGRAHDWDGSPAVAWERGLGLYYWRGVEMTPPAGRDPEWLTPRRVLRWANAERRRVAIERFGWEWFLSGVDTTVVQQDDYGRLLRSDEPVDGEALTLVEVVNSTAEPDGSYRRYVLRVPPGVRSAREAVAWTFGLRAGQYDPVAMT